jgi:hypothetical protein
LVCFRTKLTISLIAAIYSSLVFSLPILLQDQAQAEHYQTQYGGSSSSTAGCGHFVATHGAFSAVWNCAAMSCYVWDPGPFNSIISTSSYNTLTYLQWAGGDTDLSNSSSTTVFIWITRAKMNKLAYTINGNRGQRGRGITCAYWNKGPSLLINKQEDIKSILEDHKPHILGLGEANFKQGHDIQDVTIQGYKLHLDSGLDSSEVGRTARVAVYTHDLLRVKRRHDLEDDKVAAVWLECGLPHQKGVLVCMGYRQWRLLGQADDTSASVSEQLARWSTFLGKWEKALLEDKEVIVMMDANLDHLTWRNTDNLPPHHSSIRLKCLIDLLFEKIMPLGVSQLVTGATRFERGQPRSGLDHLYSNKPGKLSSTQTYITGMSDHKLMKVIRYTKSFKQLPRYVRKRSFKKFDEKTFLQKLSESNIAEVLECNDTDTATELLVSKLTGILDTLAPIITIQVRSNYVPGLSDETKLLQKERNLAQEKAAQTDDPDDWRYFRSLRNQTTAKVREDKKKWEEQRFDHAKNSSTDTWKTVKGWLGWNSGGPPTQLFSEGRIVTKPAGLASSMNRFFITKIKELRQNIPVVNFDPLKYLKEAMRDRKCKFSLKQLTIEDVLKLIKGLKNSSATGVDFIDTRTIKLGAEILAPAIQHIINLSISSSTFPDLWKWHKVVPLLKGMDCDKLLPKSYRPIALLPVLSKILEKAVFNQLVQYLEQNDLVHPNLHGSRAGHSTATALTQLYDTWVEEVEQGNMVGVLLCDQSAAFDLCDHYLLTEKLKLMGVEDNAVAWFCSYLSSRRQSCMVDGQLSAPLDIPPCGVPQGSIGGPILWLIFTCDQPDVVHDHQIDRQKADRGCSDRTIAGRDGDQGEEGVELAQAEHGQSVGGCGVMVGYVDDGAYSYAHNDPEVLSGVLTHKYNKLEEWMNANKLVINPDKTHLMVMASKKNTAKRKEVSMMAGGFIIKPTESEKLLGGQLHQSLEWNLHIRDHKGSLLNQLNSRLNGLRKVCVNASFGTKLMVANGVVMSKLAYLITLWGGAQQYLISAVQVQQLAAARAVCGFGCWRWSKRKLLDRVGWLSVRQLVFYHTVLQAHKTLKTGQPKPLHQSLTGDYPYTTRGAASGQIRQDSSFSSQSTFKFRAMQYYNSVPVSVRVGSTATVKRKLKQWINTNIPID